MASKGKASIAPVLRNNISAAYVHVPLQSVTLLCYNVQPQWQTSGDACAWRRVCKLVGPERSLHSQLQLWQEEVMEGGWRCVCTAAVCSWYETCTCALHSLEYSALTVPVAHDSCRMSACIPCASSGALAYYSILRRASCRTVNVPARPGDDLAGLTINGTSVDLLLVATQGSSVYAFNQGE